jgi:hypothetical protein
MTLKVEHLSDVWRRYHNDAAKAKVAYLVCHGSYDDAGFTSTCSPAQIHFYVMHTDAMYTVEIFQVINYHNRVLLGTEVLDAAPKAATSILGAGSPCWNYWLSAWSPTDTTEFVKNWTEGGAAGDLLMLKAGTSGFFTDAPNSRMEALFQLIGAKGLSYDVIHFCCCRSVKGERIRAEVKTTKPLYQDSNPYWPRPGK